MVVVTTTNYYYVKREHVQLNQKDLKMIEIGLFPLNLRR